MEVNKQRFLQAEIQALLLLTPQRLQALDTLHLQPPWQIRASLQIVFSSGMDGGHAQQHAHLRPVPSEGH